jgi:pimeloyl-ACP methyl ester carboxylesterase
MSQSAPDRPAFVLVHGAFHGGWCWGPVARRLRAAGAHVLTPTCTGLGDRAHLLSPAVGLSTFIADIAAAMICEELSGTILVGHSFGGAVVSGVVDARPELARALVFLDALLLQDGQCALDVLDAGTHAERERDAAARGGLCAGPPSPAAFGVLPGPVHDWLGRRMTPQPFSAMTEPIRLRRTIGAGLPCAYVACDAPAFPGVASSHRLAREQPDWRFYPLAAGHEAMVTAPDAVARLLLAIAAEA